MRCREKQLQSHRANSSSQQRPAQTVFGHLAASPTISGAQNVPKWSKAAEKRCKKQVFSAKKLKAKTFLSKLSVKTFGQTFLDLNPIQLL